jgi:cytoskeleton protein RodZ
MLKMGTDRDMPMTTAELPSPAAPENLKSVRESRGLSLQDIFTTTRISLVNLAALEDENFAKLPPPIYTKNFICKYSRTVGIDEKPLLQRYERYIAALTRPVEVSEIKNQWPENKMRYWVLYGSLALAVIVGIIVLAAFLNHGNKPAAPPTVSALPEPASLLPPSPVETAPTHAGASAAAPAVPAPSPLPPASVAAGKTGMDVKPSDSAGNAAPPAVSDKQYTYRLVIKATEQTWLKITEDKTYSREMLLKPGEEIERRAMEGFRLEIGNAGGVDVTFQEKPLGVLGKHGEVVVVSLPEGNP